MSPEDTTYCQQAIDLAHSGKGQQAYEQFCILYHHGNTEDITLLFWLAYTTPFLEEARRAMRTIERLEPNHPNLPRLRNRMSKWQQKAAYASPRKVGLVITCPYCHHTGHPRITRKVSTTGWIWFSAFFLLFLGCLFALVPVTQVSTMGKAAFFFLLVGAIGLFRKKRSYTCGHCGIALGDITH